MSTVSYILFVEKWKSLEEEGAENMQKKVGLNDRRVYFDMDGTIAKWRDVPVRGEEAGGIGVKWLNEINGNNGRFEGARVSSAEKLRAVLDSAVERKAVGF